MLQSYLHYNGRLRHFKEKSINTENQLRHNNLHVLGISERVEGSEPAEFAES